MSSVLQIKNAFLETLGITQNFFAQACNKQISTLPEKLHRSIDHTLLKDSATEDDVLQAIEIAKTYHCYSVCLHTKWMGLARRKLQGSDVIPICVIDFPLGQAPIEEKIQQAQKACQDGAQEIDMVLNHKLFFGQKYQTLLDEIASIKNICKPGLLKVIVESSQLSREELVQASILCVLGGADYVKTSTGTSHRGASVEDIITIAEVVGASFGIKASGGIATLESAQSMIQAGATRIGCSQTAKIVGHHDSKL
ncbi:MAG: deoxyribose-phosphate aldolase [Bdellovibrionales bacterium]|nr:deoxyribose-phosphate aldolase [Bdellovibrionales bacterium]